MSNVTRLTLATVIGIALVGAALYSALPGHITAVQTVKTGDAETVVKLVGDGGGGATRTFILPPAPRDTPRTRHRPPPSDVPPASERHHHRGRRHARPLHVPPRPIH